MSNYVREEKAEPKKKSKLKNGVLYGGIVVVCLLVVAGTLSLLGSLFSGVTVPTEHFKSGSKNVAIIHVDGTIGTDEANYNQEWIEGEINRARLDDDNVGIILKVNSPGGSAYSSDETYQTIMKYKKETKRPIYAYADEVMASGGYYIAAASDKIYSNRNSIIGSIGVIGFQSVDASELLNKLGVKITKIHSGKDKLMGSLTEGFTKEQSQFMQKMTDDIYEQFVGIVAKGRHMDMEKAKRLATGRIYSAKESLNNGLIDGIDRYEDFIEKMEKESAFIDADFNDITYQKQESTLFSYLKTNLGTSELQSSLNAIERLKVASPLLKYEP